MTTIGCGRPNVSGEARAERQPIIADETVAHAFDTRLEMRLVDRLELDNFLRDREIQLEVVDGVVNITGEVWTALEKKRVSDLVRQVAGGLDVANRLIVHPPE